MDFGSYENSEDNSGMKLNHGAPEDAQSSITRTKNQNVQPNPMVVVQVHNSINDEAPVTADEVVRAGGFGATDDISCILPVASDSTDFETCLQNVGSYKDSVDNKAQGHSNSNPKVGGEKIDSFNSDDLIRAGGFGATDNISSFLPVASDFTDFEAHLRDARDYEDLKEEISHPGLGWTNETN